MVQTPNTKKPTWDDSLQQVNALLIPAKEIIMILKTDPNPDTALAGLALSHALKNIGRHCQVVCPTKVNPQQIQSQLGNLNKDIQLDVLDEIFHFLPKKQLQISINYEEGSYSHGDLQRNDKGLTFTLMPENNEPPIVPLKIDTQIYINQPEVAILLEVENLAHLTQFYSQNMDFFKKVPLVNIDYHRNNTNYGKANLIDEKASSVSELVTLLLYDLRFAFTPEVAMLLHAGLSYKTNGFSKEFFTTNFLEASSIIYRALGKSK